MTIPSWLPPLFVLDPVWDNNLPGLFSIFKKDFITNQPQFDSSPVWYDRTIKDGKYPEGFKHLVTRLNNRTKIRTSDPLRATRLPWCGPSINNHSDPIIIDWTVIEPNGIKTYIWLNDPQYDYVIVLVERKLKFGKVFFIETAYHVDGQRTKNKLMASYINRITPS